MSEAQAVLFVLATLELYVLTTLVLRQAWIAFLISLLVGANIPLLSYVKPIMSEAMALWLTVSLALAIVVFLYNLRAHTLWLVTVCTLLLFLTRPEWIYLPWNIFFPLCAAVWLLLLCWRRTRHLRTVQAMGAVILLSLYGLSTTTLGPTEATIICAYTPSSIPCLPW